MGCGSKHMTSRTIRISPIQRPAEHRSQDRTRQASHPSQRLPSGLIGQIHLLTADEHPALIEHRLGAQRMQVNLRHRLHRARRYAPLASVGRLRASVAAGVARLGGRTRAPAGGCRRGSWTTAGKVLRNPLTRSFCCMLPLRVLLSFAVWIGGFFGNTIFWRGSEYYLLQDGRFGVSARDESTPRRARPAERRSYAAACDRYRSPTAPLT